MNVLHTHNLHVRRCVIQSNLEAQVVTGWFTSYSFFVCFFWFMLKLRNDCCCEEFYELPSNAAVSLHVAVLCSSDSGNGYKNKMEDSAQESV